MAAESRLEGWFVSRVGEVGGAVVKMKVKNWPDRLVMLPGPVYGFLELKAPGERPTPEQEQKIKELNAMGCIAGWASSRSACEQFLAKLVSAQRAQLKNALAVFLARRKGKKTMKKKTTVTHKSAYDIGAARKALRK